MTGCTHVSDVLDHVNITQHQDITCRWAGCSFFSMLSVQTNRASCSSKSVSSLVLPFNSCCSVCSSVCDST